MPAGGIRILQFLWIGLASDRILLAAVLHGLAIGALSLLVFWLFQRKGHPDTGNSVVALLFVVYLIAYFAIGIPMVR